MTTNDDMYYWYRCASSIVRFINTMDTDIYDVNTINVIKAYVEGLTKGVDVDQEPK